VPAVKNDTKNVVEIIFYKERKVVSQGRAYRKIETSRMNGLSRLGK